MKDPRKGTVSREVRFETLEQRVLLSADTNAVLLGDYNGSGQVEQGDLDLVLSNWGRDFVEENTAVPAAWVVDLPTDQIEQRELDAVLQFWGQSVAPDAGDGRVLPLTSGEFVPAILGSSSDVDTYSIDMQAGDDLLVTIREFGNNFTTMEATLFGPDNRAVERVTFNTGGDVDQVSVTQTGTYKLVVRDPGGSGSGAYRLTAVVIDDTVDAGNEVLDSGETFIGTLNSGDIDTFTVDANVGDDLLFTVRENGNNFTTMDISLYGPDAQLIQAAEFNTGGRLDRFNLTQSGTYTYVVRDKERTDTGSYLVTAVVIDNVIDTDNTALTSGRTLIASLGSSDIDTYTIDAQAGDDLLFTVREDGNNFTTMEVSLYGPDAALIETTEFSTGGRLDRFNLSQSGTYTLVVRDEDGFNTGQYVVTGVVIDSTPEFDNVVLENGVLREAFLGLSDIDTFSINASAGDDLLISISENGNNFTNLEASLYGPDGSLIETTAFGSSGDLDQFSIGQSGTYTIVIRDEQGIDTGLYFLTATATSSASNLVGTAAPLGTTIEVDPQQQQQQTQQRQRPQQQRRAG